MNRFKALLYSLSFIVSIILILYGFNIFPIPGTDSIVFIPPALYFSKGLGLSNPIYYVTSFTDLTHTGRFNYYVPFFPFFMGILSKIQPGIKTIFVCCSLLGMTNLLLYTWHISRTLSGKLSLSFKVLILLSITYIATYLLPTVGRPEIITILMVFLVYTTYKSRQNFSNSAYNIIICTLMALILATQVICFYFCFLFFVTYEVVNTENISRTIVTNILRFIGTLALFCIILQLSPNGLSNTIDGIRLHSVFVFTRSDRSLSLFVHYWLLAPLNFGFLVVFILCAVFYVREISSKLADAVPFKKILVLLLNILIAFGVVKFILYAGPTIYNATQFILPLSAYLLLNIWSSKKAGIKQLFSAVTLAAYLSGTILFLRGLVLFADNRQDGRTYDNAKSVVNRFVNKNNTVYVTGSLWSLFDNLDSVKVFRETNFKKDDIVIIQQAYHPFPEILKNKCTIVYDWTTAEQRKFFGIPITNSPQGFSFTICRIN
jgi:hypothetical protein